MPPCRTPRPTHPLTLMTKNLLLDAAMLIAVAVVGAVGYQLAPLLDPQSDVALSLSTCHLEQHACVATLPDGGQIEFSIEPRPIPVLKALQLQATLRGSEVRKVDVDFAGSEMQMGYNRQPLERQDGSSQRFTGQAMLPVCSTGSMAWQATVLVDTGKSVVAVPFPFVAGH